MELTPDFSISITGGGSFPKDRVLSIQTTDEAGINSDSCEIELDDYDDALQMPITEAKVAVSLGYKETGLVKIGTYFVREITLNGARRTIRLRCEAAAKTLLAQKTKDNGDTLGDIVDESAGEADFESAVDDELRGEDIGSNLQIAESDMNLITRLGHKYGAVAKPANEHLIVTKNGGGKTVSGKNLPQKSIDASEVPTYSCTFKETEGKKGGGRPGGVVAAWWDEAKGEHGLVRSGAEDIEHEIQLREVFRTKEEATQAVNARQQRKIQSNTTFSFSTAGRPDLFAEGILIINGFSNKIPKSWLIKRVEHTLNSSGFETSVECCDKG